MQWIQGHSLISEASALILQYKTITSSAFINWLWQFGRGKPLLGGLTTVKETAERNKAAREEKVKRAWETRRHRKSDKA
jgi:hypothetical protein